MKKNHTKYGPTGILWALYLIVGIVAFLVSNFYFKFTLKDAIIFGAINLVVVIVITEGIDFIFKKARLRQESKALDGTPDDESVGGDTETATTENAETEKDSIKADVSGDEPKTTNDDLPSDESVNSSEEPAVDVVPAVTAQPGGGKGRSWFKRQVAESNVDSDDTENKETVADNKETSVEPTVTEDSSDQDANETRDDALLITGRPGLGHGYWSGDHLIALKETKDALSQDTEQTVAEPVDTDSAKPRGRRANPDAVIDAPTSSISVITPDMIKPKVEPIAEERVVEPALEEKVADEPAVEEPVAEEPYLSADEFLNTTKLTSPRAIVREYQRLGGKDDIFSILMARQK